jgi:hypothetical protein
MSDHDQALAERAEDRAQADAERRERIYAVMHSHYRWVVVSATRRRAELVAPGPWAPAGWAPAGLERDITLSQDFAYWVEQHHPNPTAVVAALAADAADEHFDRYARARAEADADRGVEP